jgi:hypothetical protein
MEKVYSLLEADGLRSNGSGIYVAHGVAESATNKRRTQTGVFGVAGLNHGGERHVYWNQLLAGAQQAAREANYNLLLLSDDDAHWERMDGVLCIGYGGVARRRRADGQSRYRWFRSWLCGTKCLMSEWTTARA